MIHQGHTKKGEDGGTTEISAEKLAAGETRDHSSEGGFNPEWRLRGPLCKLIRKDVERRKKKVKRANGAAAGVPAKNQAESALGANYGLLSGE